MDVNEFYDNNKKLWDGIATKHYKENEVRLKEFAEGYNTIQKVEKAEIGELLKGKKLLHLQCHFGLDTLSLERLGAKPVGVDFSSKAVEFAREFTAVMNMEAEFVGSNIYDLSKNYPYPESFDIVYTSHGVIGWLHDLKEWAKTIAYYLKPGGFFYIIEGHPMSWIFDDSEGVSDFKVRYPYFSKQQPLEFEMDTSYFSEEIKFDYTKEYSWPHSVSEIINSLIDAGLTIDWFHEFPFISWKLLPFMVKTKDGYYKLPEHMKPAEVPLMFSIKASKIQH